LDIGNEILIKNKRLLRIHGAKAVIAPSINLKEKIATLAGISGVFNLHGFQLAK